MFTSNPLTIVQIPGGETTSELELDTTSAETKLIFANERTFLSYMYLLVLLGGISLGLLNFGDKESLICATIFAILSVSGIIYSFNIYQSRVTAIRMGRQEIFTDRTGPTLLLLAFLVVMITNFSIQFRDC
ncbi:hypothetical protein L218DRAFT_61607 [Marasmius fiardii PR-910]|nr:hypothetical protein L218DRAFT_61607 [Marasmius fiardii PR-910]